MKWMLELGVEEVDHLSTDVLSQCGWRRRNEEEPADPD